jgi:hypothetical protein
MLSRAFMASYDFQATESPILSSEEPPSMRFEEMKPEDYRRAKDAAPIAYLPWGAHE